MIGGIHLFELLITIFQEKVGSSVVMSHRKRCFEKQSTRLKQSQLRRIKVVAHLRKSHQESYLFRGLPVENSTGSKSS